MHALPSPIDTAPSSSRISVWFWFFGAMLIVSAAVFVVMTLALADGGRCGAHALYGLPDSPWLGALSGHLGYQYARCVLGDGPGTRLAPSRDVSWRIFDFGLIETGRSWLFHDRAALLAICGALRDGDAAASAWAGRSAAGGPAGSGDGGAAGCCSRLPPGGYAEERSAYLVPFGLAVGMSATIKPTAAPFGLVLLMISATYRAGLWGRKMETATGRRDTRVAGHVC